MPIDFNDAAFTAEGQAVVYSAALGKFVPMDLEPTSGGSAALNATGGRNNYGTALHGVGNFRATRLLVRQGGTFSKVRWCILGGTATGLTDWRIAVWRQPSDGGALLAESGNLVPTLGSASPGGVVLHETAMLAPFVVVRGDVLYVGHGVVGGSGSHNLVSLNYSAGMNAFAERAPQIAYGRAWSGGAVPSLASTFTTGSTIWAELLP